MIKSILFWCFAFDSTSVNGVVGSQSFWAILKVTSPVKLACEALHKMNGPTPGGGGGGPNPPPPPPPQMNKKETVICEFEMDFKKSVCWRSLRIQI